MCQVETNCFYPFEDIVPSSFSKMSIITAISFNKEMREKKTCPESADDLLKLPENACNLSLGPELKVSLKAYCKNGWARPLVGKLV